MRSLDKGIVGTDRFLIIITIIAWAFLATLIQFKPSARIILPFLTLNLLFLFLFPFRVVFPIFAVFSFAFPAFMVTLKISGYSVSLVELLFFFVLCLILIEIIISNKKFKLTTLSVLIAIFLVSTFLQVIRGYTLDYSPSFIRSVSRNMMFWAAFFPMMLYLQNTERVDRLLKYFLVGSAICACAYMLNYVGLFSFSRFEILGRPFWPAIGSITVFFPLIILLLIPFEKAMEDKKRFFYLLLLFVILTPIIPSQSRMLIANLIMECLLLAVTLIAIQKKGNRISYAFKLFIITIAILFLVTLILRIIMGGKFEILLKLYYDRLESLFRARKDISLGARRWQIWESFRFLKGHWLFGRGIGIQWSSFQGIARVDNFYFSLLVHQGIVGLAIFFSICFIWLKRSIWLIRHRFLLDSYMKKAFVVSQPVVLASILMSGFAGPGFVYTISNITILVFWIAITEYLYMKTRGKLDGIAGLEPVNH